MLFRILDVLTPGRAQTGFACGLLNLFWPGMGTIVAGTLDTSLPDVLIGVLQLLLPFAGRVWSFLWGIVMIIRCAEQADEPRVQQDTER